MPIPLLEVKGLTKRFGGLFAIDNVSFQINKGEVVGLIGPNGSGKTTLVRCIMGLYKPSAGQVLFKGKKITGLKPWEIVNRGIAGTFQVVKPFRHLPAFMNIMVAALSPRAQKKGEWVKTLEAKAKDALQFVGIGDLALEPASCLSQGDLKRLEIARAITTEPELLILDEPFGGLTPMETELLAKSVRRFYKGGRFGSLHTEGTSMLIIEHKLAELMKIVDRVVVINFGRILAQGTPAEIIANEEVIKAYIGREVTKRAS
jgi:branched-chain amino acid transport system ATP-binding protein